MHYERYRAHGDPEKTVIAPMGARMAMNKSYRTVMDANGKRRGEHCIVWEQAHGPIPKGCVVHHKNAIKTDNRLENLEMLTNAEHTKMHGIERAKVRSRCRSGRFVPSQAA